MASYLGSTNNKKDFINVEYLEHKIDGQTILLNSENMFEVVKATPTVFGVVKPDNDTLVLDSEGVLTIDFDVAQRRLHAGDAIDKEIDSEGVVINVLHDPETIIINSAGELQAVDLQVKDTLSFSQPTLLSDVLSNDLTIVRGSEGNILIDKFYVDDKMALLLGTYRGAYTSEGELSARYPVNETIGPPSVIGNNDYAYVIDSTSEGNVMVRYKARCDSFTSEGQPMFILREWIEEFRFNATTFTEAEIAALRSTITQNKVQNYTDHITQMINMSSEGAGPNPHGAKALFWSLKPFMNKDIDTQLSATSVNPVQNKVIKEALDNKENKLRKGNNFINFRAYGTSETMIWGPEYKAGQYLERVEPSIPGLAPTYTFNVKPVNALDSSEEGLATNRVIIDYLEDNYKPLQSVIDSDSELLVSEGIDTFISRIIQADDGTLTFEKGRITTGSSAYGGLTGKPQVNGHELASGNNTLVALDIQQLIDADNKLSYTLVDGLHNVAHTGDYDDLSDKPKINTLGTTGTVTLEGTKTLTQLNIARKDLFDTLNSEAVAHFADTDIHITGAERGAWNNKLNSAVTSGVDPIEVTSGGTATNPTYSVSHKNSGVTANTYRAIIDSHRGVELPYINVNVKGHITAAANNDVTIYPPLTGMAEDGYYWVSNGVNEGGKWKAGADYAPDATPPSTLAEETRLVNLMGLYRHLTEPNHNTSTNTHRNIYIVDSEGSMPPGVVVGDICLVKL